MKNKLENSKTMMVISATNTNKYRLLAFAQTPLAWKGADGWEFFW